jgi:hypothetical protein
MQGSCGEIQIQNPQAINPTFQKIGAWNLESEIALRHYPKQTESGCHVTTE